MQLDWKFPYPSQRMPVLAKNVVATSQPLAAQAGLQMLASGGNAVDAAVATAITLTVVEPNMNGIGSDAFAIVWDGMALQGLNASGRAPAGWTPERFRGREAMRTRGWDTVTVPGAVSAWVSLWQRFGKLPFEQLFEPAIRYARAGFLVTPIVAQSWEAQARELVASEDFARSFLVNGGAPKAGEQFRFPDQATTLEQIAASKGAAFYQGTLAEKIAAHAHAQGGALTLEDLAAHRADWVTPIDIEYRGLRLHEIPPNGQGIAALAALGILRQFDLAALPVDSAERVHLQLEAMKLAFADVYGHVADPSAMRLSTDALLDPDYLRRRAAVIAPTAQQHPESGIPEEGGTIYLTTADAGGMMVSYIQSNYMGFGSGVVVPGTGISLQNRGYAFSLNPRHPNCVAPGKRPFHTIIPAFVTRDGQPLMSYGVMGAVMQPQGHLQVLSRIADHRQNPQTALDAPRWLVNTDWSVNVEAAFGAAVADELRQRGHRFAAQVPRFGFGGAQAIYRLDDGYCAASDPRKDGCAVGF